MRIHTFLGLMALLPACGGTISVEGGHGAASGNGGSTSIVTGDGAGTTDYTSGATWGNTTWGTTTWDTTTCSYPPIDTPPGCPPAYLFGYNGQPCPMEGLICAYAGAGDGQPDGCNATAQLFCTSQFGDAGGPHWVAAQ